METGSMGRGREKVRMDSCESGVEFGGNSKPMSSGRGRFLETTLPSCQCFVFPERTVARKRSDWTGISAPQGVG